MPVKKINHIFKIIQKREREILCKITVMAYLTYITHYWNIFQKDFSVLVNKKKVKGVFYSRKIAIDKKENKRMNFVEDKNKHSIYVESSDSFVINFFFSL